VLSAETKGYIPGFQSMFYRNPLLLEMRWLKTMMDDRRSSDLLSSKTLMKLKTLTDEVVPLNDVVHLNGYHEHDSEAESETEMNGSLKEKIDCIHKAIENKKWLESVYRLNPETEIHSKTEPLYIEYSVRAHRYYLVHQKHDQNRPLKSRISSYSSIKLCEPEGVSVDRFASVRNQVHPEPLTLMIKDRANALERAMMTFSEYSRKMEIVENGYILKIEYPKFEYEQMIQKVLSMGKNALIIEPKSMREDLLKRITACIERLES